MYFPCGWPRVLYASEESGGGNPVKIFRHRTKDLVIELRESSVSFWHARLCVLLVCHVREKESLNKHGPNVDAVLKHDGTLLVLATAGGGLIFLKVHYEKPILTRDSQFSIRHHGIVLSAGSGFEGVGEEIEALSLRHFSDAAVVGGVKSLFSLGGQLVVATGYGVLHRLTWEGKLVGGLVIHLDQVSFTNESLFVSAKEGGEGGALNVEDVCYSPELHGMAVVMGNGRAAFLTSSSARFEPSLCQAAWLKGVTDAVCTTINTKYKLLTFGRENGTVAVFGCDESTGEWTLSHTLQFTKQQFPETCVLLGRVQSMQWSHDDQTVLAVSWQNGGLSLWSVFGSLLLCSLGDQPGTPSPLNPHCTVLESLTWSPDGYHLWMLPVNARAKTTGADTPVTTPLHRTTGVKGHLCGNREQLLVMRFLKNSVVTNPILANHSQLLLQGCDRIYLNSTTTHTLLPSLSTSSSHGGGATSHLSSPQWKILLLPPSYLVLNWPLRYAAVDEGGCNLAVAGRAGFTLYSGVNRKWKLFGNELQEQAMMCRGGLLWYRDIVVFPCRVQEKYEEIRFYWLQSNLNNSRVLHILKLLSPVVKVNLYGNYLVVAMRDGHISIFHLTSALLPTRGLVLSVTPVHEFSVARSVPQPWANTLVSLTPSSIRTEPGLSSNRRRPIDSILLNIAGRLLMLQHEPVNPYVEDNDTWLFNHPVCLVQGIEMIWTPTPRDDEKLLPRQHIMESLWLACGAAGIKVWLPLYPRDEGHPTFLSKRIMLTLNILVYPQAVLFRDAILFGLSHETALTEASVSADHSFPFATVERTTHVYLHLILRQLLRRNLGSHALQIARSCSYLPYFAHVLELMLHEVLEEEAPGSMPVPDALLPRVVEFIKQFPQFLETVGSCARKTEVALWQYLFAAVGYPRDLFELCISDGRLKTAACYLIIIQNLEPVTVSRQLATRLLDAALDSNQWELCKDLVRFLRAIGPGDVLDSVARDSATPVSAHFPKTPRAPPTPPSATGVTPSLSGPDLDRSAISMAQDHLTSGSTSSTVSLSGDFRDASGKVIRRPHFVLDMETKEEYFIELILSRHARKLLTSTCLRDLGKFAAHLDFNLEKWLARERLRAARIDNLLATVRQLHKEFQWPLPPSDAKPAPTPAMSAEPPSQLTHPTLSPSSTLEGGSPNKQTFSPDSDTASIASSSLRRPHRPPDLDLSSLNLTPISHQDITIHTSSHPPPPPPEHEEGAGLAEQAPPTSDVNEAFNQKRREASVLSSATDLDSTQISTPKMSGSVSEKVSLFPVSQKHSSEGLPGETSSLGDIAEESDWEVDSDLCAPTSPEVTVATRGSTLAEREIRYFVGLTLRAHCLEWTLALATLLLDSSLISQVVGCIQEGGGDGEGDGEAVVRVLHGLSDMTTWAASDCPGYLPFLESLRAQLEPLASLWPAPSSAKSSTPATGLPLTEDTDLPVFSPAGVGEREDNVRRGSGGSAENTEGATSCVIS